MAEENSHKNANDKLGASWFKMFSKHNWESFALAIPPVFRNAIRTISGDMANARDQKFQEWVDRMKDDGKIDDTTATILKNQIEDLPDFGGFLALYLRISTIMTTINSLVQITSQTDQYDLQSQTTPHPADEASLIQSMILDPKRTNENRKQLRRLGYDDSQIDNLILARYQTIDVNTLRDLYLRGAIGKNKLYERMRELGYTDTRTGEIIQTWELIPPPNDLVRFAYRALFSPETRNRWPWMFDTPPGFPDYMEKHGYSQDWSELYWAAHWQQPGLQETFQMLHRGHIEMDDVKYALEARGFSEYWQDKLTKISYNPYTRVDVRRMHDLGVVSTDDLIQAYKDLGYNEERAINMAKFTIKYNEQGRGELTRATILNSYRDGLLDREEAITLLTQGDMSKDVADFYITKEDYEKEKQVQDLTFDNIRERYLMNQISRNQASQQLYKMDMPANEVNAILNNWELLRYKYERIPTLTDLSDWLSKGIIDDPTFNRFMKQHGYDAESINLYKAAMQSPQQRTGRTPSRTDLEKFYVSGVIDYNTWWKEMQVLGYENKYIEWYAEMLPKEPENE